MSDVSDEVVAGGASAPLSLGPELTVAYAAAAREQLLAALTESGQGDLQLDLSGVSDFDSSGVQLLLSTQASLQGRNAKLNLVATSAAVRDALSIFGLSEVLQSA
jgi:anti-sigma B factor antagonist